MSTKDSTNTVTSNAFDLTTNMSLSKRFVVFSLPTLLVGRNGWQPGPDQGLPGVLPGGPAVAFPQDQTRDLHHFCKGKRHESVLSPKPSRAFFDRTISQAECAELKGNYPFEAPGMSLRLPKVGMTPTLYIHAMVHTTEEPMQTQKKLGKHINNRQV